MQGSKKFREWLLLKYHVNIIKIITVIIMLIVAVVAVLLIFYKVNRLYQVNDSFLLRQILVKLSSLKFHKILKLFHLKADGILLRILYDLLFKGKHLKEFLYHPQFFILCKVSLSSSSLEYEKNLISVYFR